MKKIFTVIGATAFISLFFACNTQVSENEINEITSDDNIPVTIELKSVQDEISLLTSEKELSLLHEYNEDVVDWELSREFAEFTYRLCITPELVSQLLAMGDKVEVLEPQELREEMKVKIKNSLERYM